MRVVRGRADDRGAERSESSERVSGTPANRDADHAVTSDVLDWVRERGEPAVHVWSPGRVVAFGRRDANEDGYEAAVAAASDHGFPTVERRVGGRAVAYTDSTLAFARVTPTADIRTGLSERYDAMVADVVDALQVVGVDDARGGEPPDSFCPGDHSVRADCGKLAGVAQRVTKGAALTSGVLVVDDRDAIAGVLADVYPALGVAFDPDSVGSVAAAGGDPDRVRDELEDALVGDAETEFVAAADILED
ncbi:lipoyl protein ligase domain-containing protein [Halobacterium jilantaiense]|uniref:Lipoate-protein ligase A n=1 Tax=Halobacterium jilantaiense TaxID=355548 RepID=A0A1I0PII4_9EURY|nr:lipoate--protein ligase family protein [Halobacterium jilantaiense]SEW13575.1 Lipoate-protein ligase A [Halobacterium jilantaiense]